MKAVHPSIALLSFLVLSTPSQGQNPKHLLILSEVSGDSVVDGFLQGRRHDVIIDRVGIDGNTLKLFSRHGDPDSELMLDIDFPNIHSLLDFDKVRRDAQKIDHLYVAVLSDDRRLDRFVGPDSPSGYSHRIDSRLVYLSINGGPFVRRDQFIDAKKTLKQLPAGNATVAESEYLPYGRLVVKGRTWAPKGLSGDNLIEVDEQGNRFRSWKIHRSTVDAGGNIILSTSPYADDGGVYPDPDTGAPRNIGPSLALIVNPTEIAVPQRNESPDNLRRALSGGSEVHVLRSHMQGQDSLRVRVPIAAVRVVDGFGDTRLLGDLLKAESSCQASF